MGKWQPAPCRAWEDTKKFHEHHKWRFRGIQVLGGAAIAASAATLTYVNTKLDWWVVWIITFFSFVLGTGLVFLFIYLWNLIRALPLQRNEARAKCDEFETKIKELEPKVVDDWLIEEAAEDKKLINDCLHIHSIEWIWAIEPDRDDRFIAGILTVINASVYNVASKEIKGSISIGGAHYERDTTISPVYLFHRQGRRFQITQRCLKGDTLRKLLEAKEKQAEIDIDLRLCYLQIETNITNREPIRLKDWYINWDIKVIPGSPKTYFP